MSSLVRDVLKFVSTGATLEAQIAECFMNELMSGNVNPIQTAAVLSAMTVRGESIEEITGFARAMRSNSVALHLPYETVDTCGTGGDGADTFNISTASAIVCAAYGLKIAKHGNRAVSSRSGSADVLQALGARIDLNVSESMRTLDATNLCFLFAPQFHPAMKHAMEARRQLGFRTVFNLLGPLTNPAQAKRQVLGVYKRDLVPKMAHVLRELGTVHALVVHGAGGIDELSVAGSTFVAEVRGGEIREYTLHPRQVGLSQAPLSAIVGGDAFENASILKRVLAGERGSHRDVVVYNSGATLFVGGACESIERGVRLAEEIIDSGQAAQTLGAFIGATKPYPLSEVAQ